MRLLGSAALESEGASFSLATFCAWAAAGKMVGNARPAVSITLVAIAAGEAVLLRAAVVRACCALMGFPFNRGFVAPILGWL